MDYRFHTREQQDFYEIVLLDKKPIVCDMKWVYWKYIDDNEDYFPHVHESFRMNGVDKFFGQELTKCNDEMIMQFYSTAHFYPDGKIVWMTEGTRYQSTISEWGKLINAPRKMKMILMCMESLGRITTPWLIYMSPNLMQLWRLTSLDLFIICLLV